MDPLQNCREVLIKSHLGAHQRTQQRGHKFTFHHHECLSFGVHAVDNVNKSDRGLNGLQQIQSWSIFESTERERERESNFVSNKQCTTYGSWERIAAWCAQQCIVASHRACCGMSHATTSKRNSKKAQDLSGKQNEVQLLLPLIFGRILVRDMLHCIQVTETSNWPMHLHL